MGKKVKKWLLQSRWKKAQWCALSVIKLKNKIAYRAQQFITIQSHIRMWRCTRTFKPKFEMIKKVRALQQQRTMMDQIVSQLKKDKDAATKQVKAMEQAQEAFIQKIRTSALTREEMSNTTNQLMSSMDAMMKDLNTKLSQQKSAEEQERLRKIQEQMEKDRKQKEEEERKRKEEEEQR